MLRCILYWIGLSLIYAFMSPTLFAQKKDLLYYPKHTPPSYHPVDEAAAIRIDTSIVIDGLYDELWDRIHIYPIERLLSGESDGAWDDMQGGFQIAWNESDLFLHVLVVDESPQLGQGDEILLAFGVPDKGVQHLLALTDAEPEFKHGSLQGLKSKTGPPPPSGSARWPQSAGYTIELSIPLEQIGITATDGALFGMNVWITDADEGNTVESQWEWAGGLVQPGDIQRPLGKVTLISSYYAGSESAYLPDQIWQEKEGMVIVEPELIERHSHWQLKTSPAGFTGPGYLEWQGADWSVPPEPWVRRSNNDHSNERQPPQEEWLIVRVFIETPGTYLLDVRNIHKKEDGDNDTWFGRVGEPFHPGHPISRLGDNLKDGTGFTWLDWGVRELELDSGLHNFFLGGRSRGFGVDRVVLYLKDDADIAQKALAPSTEASELWK